MKKTTLISVALIISSFIVGIYFYGLLPETVASHWDSAGNVNGYMPKFWGVFFLPLLTLGMFIMMKFFPKIDPLKKNIIEFIEYYDSFILAIVAFMFYVFLLTLSWNLGCRFDMGQLIVPGIGLLFIFIGFMLDKTKRNWFIGIKTPWTLSSENVWNKTHKIGAKLFIAAGIISMLGIVFPQYSMWLLLGPILGAAVFLFAYSYYEYSKENQKS